MSTYSIVRHFFKKDRVVIKSGLTLEEAQDHCSNPETSSSTAKTPEMVEYTEKNGMWFDGYTEEWRDHKPGLLHKAATVAYLERH